MSDFPKIRWKERNKSVAILGRIEKDFEYRIDSNKGKRKNNL